MPRARLRADLPARDPCGCCRGDRAVGEQPVRVGTNTEPCLDRRRQIVAQVRVPGALVEAEEIPAEKLAAVVDGQALAREATVTNLALIRSRRCAMCGERDAVGVGERL